MVGNCFDCDLSPVGGDWEDCDELSNLSVDDDQNLSDYEEKENPFVNSSSSKRKLQIRKQVSKARWDDDICLAEVVEKKGALWTTTGIVRNGRLYLFLEEALFLATIGAVTVSDSNGSPLDLTQLAEKLAEGRNRCCFKSFMLYKKLKSLGYIVGRHNVSWSVKNLNSPEITSGSVNSIFAMKNSCTSQQRSKCEPNKEEDESISVTYLLGNVHLNEIKPVFDIYLPNYKFRKSSPGDPRFSLCLFRDVPPSKAEFEGLERESKGTPLKYCHVGRNAHMIFFSSNKVELPHLP